MAETLQSWPPTKRPLEPFIVPAVSKRYVNFSGFLDKIWKLRNLKIICVASLASFALNSRNNCWPKFGKFDLCAKFGKIQNSKKQLNAINQVLIVEYVPHLTQLSFIFTKKIKCCKTFFYTFKIQN